MIYVDGFIFHFIPCLMCHSKKLKLQFGKYQNMFSELLRMCDWSSSSKHSCGSICDRHSGQYTDLKYFYDCGRQICPKWKKNYISIYTQQKFSAAAIMLSNVFACMPYPITQSVNCTDCRPAFKCAAFTDDSHNLLTFRSLRTFSLLRISRIWQQYTKIIN